MNFLKILLKISGNFRYLFSSCGPAQWRLNGLDADENAPRVVEACPVPGLMIATAQLAFLLFVLSIVLLFSNPYILVSLPVMVVLYYYFKQQ
jgi:hypothetical protein